MPSQSPISESKPEGDIIDGYLPSNPDGGIPASSSQEGNNRAARFESFIADQTATISALVEKIQDTNRLLKILVSQKAPEVSAPESLLGAAPENEPGLRSPPIQDNDRTTSDPKLEEEQVEKEREHRVKQRLHALWKEYHDSPPSPEVLEAYRGGFWGEIGHFTIQDTRVRDAVIVANSREPGADGAISGHMEVIWDLQLPWSSINLERAMDGKSALGADLSRLWYSSPVGVAWHFVLNEELWV